MRKINICFCCILFMLCTAAYSQDPDFHIYLCFGQSNMAGAGSIEAKDKTVDSRFQMMEPIGCTNLNRTFGKWYPAVPPLWGCNGGLGPSDYFGRTMVENLPSNIKVGVIVVGIPGCDIALFFKSGYEGYDTYNYVPQRYGGSAYAWLLDLAKLAQKDGVIKGFLLHQGETNNGQKDWPWKVKSVYDNLISDLGLVASETPLLAGELLYQNMGGVCWGHNEVIKTVPDVIPNSYVISAEGLPGKDQFHFNTEGNRLFGVRYAQKMLTLLVLDNNDAPEVSITSPSDNSSFSSLETVTIEASASDPDGSVACVKFYDGSVFLGSDSTAPYSYQWSGMNAGTHSITAEAIDDKGRRGVSDPVSVIIEAVQGPYKGTAHAIPGRIEAEEYDLGGEGIAYHEANANGNEGNAAFRNDQVDIEATADESGEYNICYILQGEWLEYTVDIALTGKYDIALRVAADGDGKRMHIEIDGVNITGSIEVPNTGGWQTWTTVTVKDIDLVQGQHVMRVAFDANYMNLNYMEFTNTSTALRKKDRSPVKLSPVVFSDEGFQIRTNGQFDYRITSINGTLLESGSGNRIKNTGIGLSQGIYILHIRNSGGIYTRKILKK